MAYIHQGGWVLKEFAWTGLIVGFLLGIVLQRGRVCFNSSFRDTLLMRDNYLWKIVILTLVMEAVSFHVMAHFGMIKLNPFPFNPIGDTLGGFVFGIGMILGGGCASGVTYRVGEGATTAWFAALFYGLTVAAVKNGILSPWTSWLANFNVEVPSPSPLFIQSSKATDVAFTGPSITSLTGISPWIVVILFVIPATWYIFGTKTSERKAPWDWRIIALLLALISSAAYWIRFSTHNGRTGLGITGGWADIMATLFTGEPATWITFEVLGIILGAFAAAYWSKEFKLRMPRHPSTYVQSIAGGILMGFGAATAGGCNIGHMLVGVPQFALSSITATVFFVMGNWAMVWFMYMRKKE